jgi:hypothetical protein
MEGVQIAKTSGATAAALSALAAAGSLAAAVWIGPRGIYVASGLGLAMAAVSLLQALRVPSLEKPYGFPILMLSVHGVLLLAGVILQVIFLSPLTNDQARMPHLQTPYEDPDGLFALRGPANWTYRPVPSRYESGVRLQPSDQGHYIGISEAAVFVRRLDSKPASPDAFLQKAAAAFTEKQSNRHLFDLKTERGTSLSGAPLIWSTITIRRFWVPLYQISVFGVKDRRYLCSVSATGLSAHSRLARVFCLGLFERTVITDRGS